MHIDMNGNTGATWGFMCLVGEKLNAGPVVCLHRYSCQKNKSVLGVKLDVGYKTSSIISNVVKPSFRKFCKCDKKKLIKN